jgi:hypothetical protein
VIFDGDMSGVLSSRGHKIWDVSKKNHSLVDCVLIKFQDTNLEDMHAVPVAAPHRPVDLESDNPSNLCKIKLTIRVLGFLPRTMPVSWMGILYALHWSTELALAL